MKYFHIITKIRHNYDILHDSIVYVIDWETFVEFEKSTARLVGKISNGGNGHPKWRLTCKNPMNGRIPLHTSHEVVFQGSPNLQDTQTGLSQSLCCEVEQVVTASMLSLSPVCVNSPTLQHNVEHGNRRRGALYICIACSGSEGSPASSTPSAGKKR